MRQAAQGAQEVDGYDLMATGIRVFMGGSNVDQASIHSFLLGHGPFNKKKTAHWRAQRERSSSARERCSAAAARPSGGVGEQRAGPRWQSW